MKFKETSMSWKYSSIVQQMQKINNNKVKIPEAEKGGKIKVKENQCLMELKKTREYFERE